MRLKRAEKGDVRGYHVCKDVWKPAIGEIQENMQNRSLIMQSANLL